MIRVTLALGYIAFWLGLLAAAVGTWYHGFTLAWHASPVLGVGTMFFVPVGTFIGAVDWLTHVDIAVKIAKVLGL